MIGIDAQHIAFAGSAQIALDITDATDAIGRNEAERHSRRDRALDYFDGKPRLGRKADATWHGFRFQAGRIISPVFRQ